MKFLKALLVTVFGLYSFTAYSLPTTDIGILDLGKLISSGKNKTLDFKPLTQGDGYDNQPKFSADGKTLYFTRGITDKNGKSQTDIMAYSFADQSFKNISNSLDSSEYSPTPYQDGFLTIIGVADSNGKQYLNQLSIVSGAQETFTETMEPIGYHAWLNDNEAAVFVLGEVMTLQVLNTSGKVLPEVLDENIGRCMQRLSNNRISYTAEAAGQHRIYILDKRYQSRDTGIVLPEGVQDYAWLNDKDVIFGQGAKLFIMNKNSKSEIIDLSKQKIKTISRIAVDNNNKHLAMVFTKF